LLRAGIGTHATARLADGAVVVEPRTGSEIAHEPAAPGPGAAPADAPVVAEAHGVVKRFGDTVVLDGVDAAFAGGRLHAITGPSGSGKTTFLHLLAGLDLPD